MPPLLHEVLTNYRVITNKSQYLLTISDSSIRYKVLIITFLLKKETKNIIDDWLRRPLNK